MPEGNEIHRFAELHTATFVGKTICVESPNGRFPGAALLTGRKLKAVIAHGKHLAYDFGRDLKLHVHMGRFGDFTEGKMPYPEVKGILRMRWSTATDWLELRGATDVSVYSDAQWQAVRDRLGADPLEPHADPSPGIAYIRKANTPIAALLMDQTVFAGIGNIYRAELLYRARQNPFAPGKDVPEKTLKALWRDAVKLMPDGMVDRRIVTTRAKDRPAPKRQSTARRGPLRLPPPRPTLLRLRHHHPTDRPGRPHPLLVPHLPTRQSPRPTQTRAALPTAKTYGP